MRPRPKRDTQIFPANWRNEESGNWEIGLWQQCAIYNGRFWEYKEKDEKHGRFVITNGDKELSVAVGKNKNGVSVIRIGDCQPVKCRKITGRNMSYYPSKDDRPALKDNGYRTGDSVTIVGWMKDMCPASWERGDEFVALWNDVYSGKECKEACKMDSLGRFSMTIPIVNTQEVFMDWRTMFVKTILEPGETYFFFADFSSGQTLFMGNDCRLQNELLAVDVNSGALPRIVGRDDKYTDIDFYLRQLDEYDMRFHSQLNSITAAHPTLSERCRNYLSGENLMRQAEALGQARFMCEKFMLPQNAVDYACRKYWQCIPTPYTAYSRWVNIFIRDFIDDLRSKSSQTDGLSVGALIDEGIIKVTEEERKAFDVLEAKRAKVVDAIQANPDKWREIEAEYTKENAALIAVVNAVCEDEANGKIIRGAFLMQTLKQTDGVLDSLGTPPVLRDVVLAATVIENIDHERMSFPEQVMKECAGLLQFDGMKKAIAAQNDIYVLMENGQIAENSRPKRTVGQDDVKDGEELLRKIVEQFKGQPVLIDVWGTWCVPCKMALQQSKEEYAALAPYNMVFLYLANNSQQQAVENVIKEYDVQGPDVYHYNLPKEQQEAIEKYLMVKSYPSYRLIDRDGKLLDVNADPRNLDAFKKTAERLFGDGK